MVNQTLADVAQELPVKNCLAMAVSEDKKSWIVLDGVLGVTEIAIKVAASATSQQPRFATPTKALGKRGMKALRSTSSSFSCLLI